MGARSHSTTGATDRAAGFEYGLTDRGRSLLVPVSALADRAVEHA